MSTIDDLDFGKELKGKTLVTITKAVSEDEIIFTTSDGHSYKLYHDQSCCESVTIEDICGDFSDLLHAPLLEVEESVSEGETPEGVPTPEYQDESFTWTFYKLSTIKGSVTIRWYGESNGYYSESVDFVKITE